jgi:hypothetical protein
MLSSELDDIAYWEVPASKSQHLAQVAAGDFGRASVLDRAAGQVRRVQYSLNRLVPIPSLLTGKCWGACSPIGVATSSDGDPAVLFADGRVERYVDANDSESMVDTPFGEIRWGVVTDIALAGDEWLYVAEPLEYRLRVLDLKNGRRRVLELSTSPVVPHVEDPPSVDPAPSPMPVPDIAFTQLMLPCAHNSHYSR